MTKPDDLSPPTLLSLLQSMRERETKRKELEDALADSVTQFLSEEKGYPTASIARNSKVYGSTEVDIALVDPQSKTVLAIVELLTDEDIWAKTRRNQAQRLAASRVALKNLSLPLFAAVASAQQGFTLWRLNDEVEWEALEAPRFPEFSSLRVTRVATELNSARSQQQRADAELRRLGALVLLLLGELLVLSASGLWVATWEALSLVAGISAVSLLPHLRSLKVAGIEVRRLSDAD